MKYIGVRFTSCDNPFNPQSKIYYYKTNLEFSSQTAYKIKCGDEEYRNPVIVVNVSRKAPDPSIVYKEITEIKPIAYQKRDLPDWILPKDVYFNAENGGVTCIIWKNNEKTVVRCNENGLFDFFLNAQSVIKRFLDAALNHSASCFYWIFHNHLSFYKHYGNLIIDYLEY